MNKCRRHFICHRLCWFQWNDLGMDLLTNIAHDMSLRYYNYHGYSMMCRTPCRRCHYCHCLHCVQLTVQIRLQRLIHFHKCDRCHSMHRTNWPPILAVCHKYYCYWKCSRLPTMMKWLHLLMFDLPLSQTTHSTTETTISNLMHWKMSNFLGLWKFWAYSLANNLIRTDIDYYYFYLHVMVTCLYLCDYLMI